MEKPLSKNERPPCCCPPQPLQIIDAPAKAKLGRWIMGSVQTPIGMIPKVGTILIWRDRLASWKVRWGIGRMRYRVEPGLYAVGSPTPESPVFVSANYKMSFDCLRSQLSGRDGWILVLDTKGVNVWCSAGKGTFGTAELVKRLEITRVKDVVSHHTLILPQLGATGVSAHEVKRLSGFRVVYGPVLAKDLPVFIDAGMKATPEMRQVRFPFMARIVLAPIEIVSSAKYALPVAVVFALLSGLGSDGYDFLRVTTFGLWSVALIVISWLAGAALTPSLLPWLPARSFSAKGGLVGLLVIIVVAILMRRDPGLFVGPISALSWLFIIPAITSFLGMNFTGASTYTSLSGVRREMRLALPMQISSAAVGLGLWITGLFV